MANSKPTFPPKNQQPNIDRENDGTGLLSIEYIPLSQALLWEDNAKNHDFPRLITAIQTYGFRDPPSWDNTLQAIVEGNGRITALRQMQNQKMKVPRGITTDKTTGEWCVPVLFGMDSESKSQAVRYAVDHNNLVMAGGDFSVNDMARMWDAEGYRNIIASMMDDDENPVTMDREDMEKFLKGMSDKTPKDNENVIIVFEKHQEAVEARSILNALIVQYGWSAKLKSPRNK